MARYAALLRGVNVGGRQRVDMAALRDCLSEAGYRDVSTYIQSGNVLFGAPAVAEATLADRMQRDLRRAFGLDVTVLIRSRAQLQRISTKNPWLRSRADPSTLHITFLGGTPSRAAARELAGRPSGADECVVAGREVYLRCPGGYGRTKLTNSALEHVLDVPATTRNWKTVLTLRDLAAA